MKERKGENCMNCGSFVEGFEYQTCCSGRNCGCLGMPIEPCFCSEECEDIYKNRNPLSKEERTFKYKT